MKPLQITCNILILFGTLIIILNSSCKKYLDKKSDSTLTVPATLSDLQGLLDDGNLMNIQTTPSLGEASSDDYFIPEDVYNSLIERERRVYTWTLGEYKFQNDWSVCYTPIYNSNICLETINKISKSEKNEAEWNNIKGSALFFRAYYFFNLSMIYAKAYDRNSANSDLGIVLRMSSDFNIVSERASVAATYNQIVSDTKESALYLPDHPLHVMRPSKAAAFGLLAKVYLSMREYDSAFKYSNLCLQIKDELIDYNNDNDINGSLADNTPFKRFNKETIFYTEMNTKVTVHYPWQAYIDSLLYQSYDDNDLRKIAFFYDKNGYKAFKGGYAGNQYLFFSGIATDEIYLIRSECNARANRTAEAVTDLNTLLQRRWAAGSFTPFSDLNQSETVKMILSERRKELLMRGGRWMDIKRLNKEGADITPNRETDQHIFSLKPNSDYYALPLPDDIIKITGIPQN